MNTCPHGKHIPKNEEAFRICSQCRGRVSPNRKTLDSKIKLVEDAIILMLEMGYDASNLMEAHKILESQKLK